MSTKRQRLYSAGAMPGEHSYLVFMYKLMRKIRSHSTNGKRPQVTITEIRPCAKPPEEP